MIGGARYVVNNSTEIKKMINSGADQNDILRNIRRDLANRLRKEYKRLKNKKNFKIQNLYAMLELDDEALNGLDIDKKIFFEMPKAKGVKANTKLPDKWFYSLSYFQKDGKNHMGIILSHPDSKRSFKKLNPNAKEYVPGEQWAQSGGYVKLSNGKTRKVRTYKNGTKYILLNGKKVSV